MLLIMIGSNFDEAESFEPAQVPTNKDVVKLTNETPNINVTEKSTCLGIFMNDFENDINYDMNLGANERRLIGTIKNENKYDIFIFNPSIQRLD